MSVTQGHSFGRLEELRQIVPTEQIEAQTQSSDGRSGAWAVEPATVDELIDVVRWANSRDAAVYTRHPRPRDTEVCKDRSRIYLRARRMKRVRDLDLVSGTITVQSGMTMKELHEILVEHSLTTGFATRPWDHEAVGAVIASAMDSHWGPKYGSMEEHVVGLGVVLPDGTTTTTRIAPRKAVGPDFNQLFLGSRGRFGIVHEATLKVFPSSSRIVLSYGSKNLRLALDALSEAFERGLSPRAMEVMTPAPDRAFGRRRVGLTDDYPVLILVEPWALDAGRRIGNVDSFFSERLKRLEPPLGWDVHEGLLPPPRAWTSPVVGCRWSRLLALADDLGDDVPQGLWLVRVSRHGGWLSLADGVHGERADIVRETVREHIPSGHTPLLAFQDALKKQLDPRGILNPS